MREERNKRGRKEESKEDKKEVIIEGKKKKLNKKPEKIKRGGWTEGRIERCKEEERMRKRRRKDRVARGSIRGLAVSLSFTALSGIGCLSFCF